MTKVKLILFDLDGTLVDSAADVTHALNHALRPYGYGDLSVEEAVKLVGEGLTSLVAKVLGVDGAVLKEEVLERFLGYYTEHLTDFTRPYPEVIELLEGLKSYRKAVVSNKRESLSTLLLTNLKMYHYFDHIIGADSTPEKKPSPLPLLTVLDREGVKAEEAVMVGDSNLDIEAGRSAGVTTVAVCYGYRPVEALSGADYYIRDQLSELHGILEELES